MQSEIWVMEVNDWRVRAAVRRPDLAFHLQPLGGVGQVTAFQANLRYPDSVEAALRGADAAVNLVGVLTPRGRQTYDAVQSYGAQTVAEAVKAAGLTRFAHVSAIGADMQSPSAYGRSKAEGEAHVRAATPGAVIFRPSFVFGPEDEFFNRFATLARLSPVMPVAGAQTRAQPVFVGDVAEAIARDRRARRGGQDLWGGRTRRADHSPRGRGPAQNERTPAPDHGGAAGRRARHGHGHQFR